MRSFWSNATNITGGTTLNGYLHWKQWTEEFLKPLGKYWELLGNYPICSMYDFFPPDMEHMGMTKHCKQWPPARALLWEKPSTNWWFRSRSDAKLAIFFGDPQGSKWVIFSPNSHMKLRGLQPINIWFSLCPLKHYDYSTWYPPQENIRFGLTWILA